MVAVAVGASGGGYGSGLGFFVLEKIYIQKREQERKREE